MKRLIGLILAVAGGALCLFSAYYLIITSDPAPGNYHPMYPGLLGIALLTVGLIMRQD